jgi:hypothetical protein
MGGQGSLTAAVGADVLALLNGIAFGAVASGLRTSAGYRRNSVAFVIDVIGGQDLAAITATAKG